MYIIYIFRTIFHHLCRHVYHNVSADVRSGILQVVGMSNLTLYFAYQSRLFMAQRTRTVYPGKRNKGLSSTFQPPEERRSVQQPKRCDKHGDKDEGNSPKMVNNVDYHYIQDNVRLINCRFIVGFFFKWHINLR